MLYDKLRILVELIPNEAERKTLEGKYLFHHAVRFLSNEAGSGNTDDQKQSQISNLEDALQHLITKVSVSESVYIALTKNDVTTSSDSLQRSIVRYIVNNNYSDLAFRNLAQTTESITRSGVVQNARMIRSVAKEDNKYKTEYRVLVKKYADLLNRK